jgi:hypothetical protein
MLVRHILHLCSLFILLSLFALPANATYRDTFPIQSGFNHSPSLGWDDTGAGKQLLGQVVRRGSPTIAEIDGNTGNGKEIVIGGRDGRLYVHRANGSLLWWKMAMPVSSCTYPAGDGALHSAPSVGALYGDGVPYVVVAYGSIQGPSSGSNCPGGVVAFDGRNGNERWRYVLNTSGEALHGTLSTPGLADVDGDGKLEVGFGDFERNITLLNHNGSVRWKFHNADTVWSSPAFADVDGDGLPDMIIGSDISANNRINPPTSDGGYITAFKGSTCGKTTAQGACQPIWRKFYNQVIWSSPAIADLDGNGVKEVIIGSGCYDHFSPQTRGHWVKILDIRNGNEIRTLNAQGCTSASPAIGDIDNDGKLEIVTTVNGRFVGKPGVVQAWDYENSTPKWTIDPRIANGIINDQDIDLGSPVLADLDGNGSIEVIVSHFSDVAVFRGDNGAQLTCRNCSNGTRAMFTFYTLQSTPAVGDIDGDGDLEVVIGGGNRNTESGPGYLYVWTNFAGLLGSPSGTQPKYAMPWPMFKNDPRHVSVFAASALRANTNSISLLTKRGGPARTFQINLNDQAAGALSWTASKNQSWITLNRTSGSTPTSVIVTVNPSGLSNGTHTGVIDFKSSFGQPRVTVTVQVMDQVRSIYGPVIMR